MARDFTPGSSQYLSIATAAVTGFPCSFSAWINIDDVGGNDDRPVLVVQQASAGEFIGISLLDHGASNLIDAVIRTGGAYYFVANALTPSTGTWHHCCAVFVSTTDVRVIVNGTATPGNPAAPGFPSGVNATYVGAEFLGSLRFFDGRIAEAAIWSVALTNEEAAALSKGMSPLLIRAGSLAGYWPLYGIGSTEPDRWKNQYTLTVNGGAARAAHVSTLSPGSVRVCPPPAAARVIGTYTVTVTIGGVVRQVLTRVRGLSITDVLDEAPNTARFSCHGFTPLPGQEVRIAFGTSTLFAGHILRVTQSYDADNRAHVVYHVDCQDYTWQLDRRLVSKVYGAQPATTIIHDLIASNAPGFTGGQVAADLPTVDDGIEFTDETCSGAMTRVMKRIGGYWSPDYTKDIRAFLTDASDPPDDLTDAAPFREFEVETDLSQIRTRVYVEGGGSNALAEVAAGATTIPVQDASWYRESGGLAKVGSQRVAYESKVNGGAGALVGTTVTPTNAPTLAAAFGTGLITGNYDYAVTFQTASGETLPSPIASIDIDTTPLSSPATIGAASAVTNAGITSNNGLDDSAAYSYKYTFWHPGSGGETTPSPASNTFTTGSGGFGAKTGRLARNQIQSPPAGCQLQLYRTEGGGSTYKATSDQDDDADFLYDGWADASLNGIVGTTQHDAPGANTLVRARVALSNIPVGPTGTTGRRIYRTVANGSQLKLVTTIANNTATTHTDSTADGSLGANVPTTDTSGLTSVNGEVQAGSTTIVVTSMAPFRSAGGWAHVGGIYIRYAGLSGTALTGVPASGVGALTITLKYGSEIVAAPMLVGVPPSGAGSITHTITRGAAVNVLAQRDDADAQAALAALEGGDGVHEHVIRENRLALATAEARGDAELALFKNPIIRIRYKTRDPKTRSGKTITVNIGPPQNISGAFKIQRVTRTEIFDEINGFQIFPLCDVEASSVKFSLEDLLRRVLLAAA